VKLDRERLLAHLGDRAVRMSPDALADTVEEWLMAQLPAPEPMRPGAGLLFGGATPLGGPTPVAELSPMPRRPTLVDFFRLRFVPMTVSHMLQSAADAQRKGAPEEIVFACLVHDLAMNLVKVDHGYWTAQMLEPYVSGKVTWAIRHHQALRFFADKAAGYEYPDSYVRIFGKGYVPEPYIKAAYRAAAGIAGTWQRE
jgi:hypothetical protein